jgi:hypothetical protein
MGITELKKETGMDAPEWREGERSETSRNGGASIPAAAPTGKPPGAVDPEVDSKVIRRRFSARYKLYSSHITTWRKQRELGEIAGLEPRKRGKKPVPRNPLAAENEKLRRETQRLQKHLHQAEVIIDVQKKLCDLLGLTVPPIEMNESDE